MTMDPGYGQYCPSKGPTTIPGVAGPGGLPFEVRGPYVYYNPPRSAQAAAAMMSPSQPLEKVQQASYQPGADLSQVLCKPSTSP